MNTRRLCSALLPVLLLFTATAMQAGVIYTTDVTEFQSWLQPGYVLQTFNSLPVDQVITAPVGLSSGLFSYSATAGGGTFYNANIGGSDVVFSTTSPDNPITFTFSSGNVTAVGGYFWNTDMFFETIPGTVALTLSGGTTVNQVNPVPGSFLGFYSTDQPINWLRITPGSGAYATVSDLYVGGTATPEPGTVACVVGGLLALTALRRRLRR